LGKCGEEVLEVKAGQQKAKSRRESGGAALVDDAAHKQEMDPP
jgi:hypothetical protein